MKKRQVKSQKSKVKAKTTGGIGFVRNRAEARDSISRQWC
jgi:hypothetical protein